VNREKAKAALDDAFADSLKGIYGVLIQNIINGDDDAQAKFATGLSKRVAALAVAENEVERIFPA
jgi:hypothetical protein